MGGVPSSWGSPAVEKGRTQWERFPGEEAVRGCVLCSALAFLRIPKLGLEISAPVVLPDFWRV